MSTQYLHLNGNIYFSSMGRYLKFNQHSKALQYHSYHEAKLFYLNCEFKDDIYNHFLIIYTYVESPECYCLLYLRECINYVC